MVKKIWKDVLGSRLADNGYSPDEAQTLIMLEMQAIKYFNFENMIPQALELEDIERDEKAIHYFWRSRSSEAECPECHTISRHVRKDTKCKPVQDIASDGLAVYHRIKSNRYYCDNPGCGTSIFVERFYEFTEEQARKTLRFKDRCREMALSCGGLGAEREIRSEGSVICDDTILKYLKVGAAEAIKSNLTRDDVKILSIDDFNIRKGDSSSGCTVFIDQQTHKVLVIVRGVTKEAVEEVMKKFPSSEFLSRDRACSLSSAGDACGKTQVADRFHLVQNIHKAIEDALSAELPMNIYLREGDGWEAIIETPDKGGVKYTVPEDDLEKRIQLAGLTKSKAEKYRNTLKMLEMSDAGLRTADIAKALGITPDAVKNLRWSAMTTIKDVQDKIKRRIELSPASREGQGAPPADRKRDAAPANPRPASRSIVEPYRDTVVQMWNAGINRHQIYLAISEKGFSGNESSVYQYIRKLGGEDPCVLTRKAEQKEPGAQGNGGFDRQAAQSLPDLSLSSVPRGLVYKSILSEGRATRQKEDGPGSPAGEKKAEVGKPKSKKPAMAKYSPLDKEYLDLMYGKDDGEKPDEGMADPKEACDGQGAKKNVL
jgi:hypothetical protein